MISIWRMITEGGGRAEFKLCFYFYFTLLWPMIVVSAIHSV